MNKAILLILTVVVFLAIISCSGESPIAPRSSLTPESAAGQVGQSQTHLWGLYDVYIDLPTQTATAVVARATMFTANVVNFVNSKPAGLSFKFNGKTVGSDWVDVDIDLTITHPFPGMTQYNGYDVRGVFMGDGSANLAYNPSLMYSVLGTDQLVLEDPDDHVGGPDGYTRWFNKAEFSTGGMPLFQYTQGKLATSGFNGTATLNACKYFADGLGADEDLWAWLNDNADQHGVFSAGTANTRNYYLRFPNGKGVKFGYAITANWKGLDPQYHPSNAPEAVATSVVDQSTVYFADSSNKGGDLRLNLNVWDWDSTVSAGVMEDYRVFIESTVLTSVYELTASEMTPTGGADDYSTYHVEIPADNIQDVNGNEYWVIVEQKGHDYTNEIGVPNLADTDPLAAFFRFDLKVYPESPTADPICDVDVVTEMPYAGWATLIEFDASGSYDPQGGSLSYEWDFDGDGSFGDSYDAGTPDKPQKMFTSNYLGDVCVRVANGSGGQSECCVAVDITTYPSKNIPLRTGVDAMDIAVDHADGDLLIVYSDGKVFRYLESGYYQTGNQFCDTGHPGVNHIDISPNSRFKVGGNNDKTVCWHASYDPDGNVFSGSIWNWPPNGVYEVMAVTWDTSNDQITIEDWPLPSPPADYHYNRWLNYYDFHMGSGWYAWDGTGAGAVDHDWVKGLEAAKSAAFTYVLEGAPEFRVEKWDGGAWTYAGVNWGGIQSDGMDGFNDPKDITRDSSENYYILDDLTSGPAIKKYTSAGTPVGSPFGGYGIAGDPLKIEGSDYMSPWDNLLFVIHDGDANPDMLSIFFKSEIP